MFSEKEIAYLKAQPLARLATASNELQPDVVPAGFNFDGVYFYVSGRDLTRTLKYKNVQRNPKVSRVVDDLEPGHRWKPRGIKIAGTADLTQYDGYVGPGTYIRIRPEAKRSWGIE